MCTEKHGDCYEYKNEPFILYEEKQGEIFVPRQDYDQLFFLLKGKVQCNFRRWQNDLDTGYFMLFPRKTDCIMTAEECSKFVVVKMHHNMNFCNRFSRELLFNIKNKATSVDTLHVLKYNEIIAQWLQGIVKITTNSLKCSYYQDLRRRELLYYLRVYYSKEDLCALFAPVLNSGDIAFEKQVYQHYKSAKNINELAKKTHYSVSGFKNRFIKVFGVLPSVWLDNQKATEIYEEINCNSKSFKEIAHEYDFSSPARLNEFCKKMYKMTPGELRKKTTEFVLLN